MRRRHTLILLSATLLAGAACRAAPEDGAGESTTHRVEQALEDGVATLVNHGGPKFSGEIFRYEKIVELEGVYLGDTTWPRIQRAGRVVRGHLLAMVFNEETLQLAPTVFRIEPAVVGLEY